MATRTRKSSSLTTRYLPVMPALDVDAVSSAVLNGAKVDAKLANAVTGGEIELAMDQATQLSLPFEDPEYAIWLSDLFADLVKLDLGEAGRWRYDRKGDIGGVGLTGTSTTLTLWAAGEAALRAASGPLRKSSAKLDLAGVVALLAREPAVRDVVKLRTVVPKSGEVPPADTTSERTSASSAPRTGGFSPAAAAKIRVKHVKADAGQVRAIEAILSECDRLGADDRVKTAAIMCATQESVMRNVRHGDARRNDTIGFFQQGPEWISPKNTGNPTLATRAFLLGSREAKAGGTGNTRGWKQHFGSLKTAPADLESAIKRVQVSIGGYRPWQADAQQAVRLWTGGTAASSKTTTRTVKRPGEWRRGARESTWTMLDRYARLFGCRRFVALPLSRQPRLVVARDQDLIRAAPHLTLAGLTDEIFTERPQLTLEGNAHLKTMEFRALAAGWSAPPGAVVRLENAGAQTPETWLVQRVRVPLGNSPDVGVVLQQPTTKVEAPPATSTAAKSKASSSSARSSSSSSSATDRITTTGGARGIVEQAARLAASAGGSGVYVGSDYRPGSTTSSGNASDHASNNAQQAARDIGVRGIDLLVGPPSPKLDQGVAAIGKAFGRSYGNGRRLIIDTFQWRGYRVQIIWRTPKYGGHMGHIHIGARRS